MRLPRSIVEGLCDQMAVSPPVGSYEIATSVLGRIRPIRRIMPGSIDVGTADGGMAACPIGATSLPWG